MATQKPAMTINQAAMAFGVSTMCLYGWRNGTPTKDPLPASANGRTILIDVAQARKWAKAHGVEFAIDPDKVLANKATAPGKPGPKTKATEKPAAKKSALAIKQKAKPVAKKTAVKAKPVAKSVAPTKPPRKVPAKPAVTTTTEVVAEPT